MSNVAYTKEELESHFAKTFGVGPFFILPFSQGIAPGLKFVNTFGVWNFGSVILS
jgi:hypothetical protein